MRVYNGTVYDLMGFQHVLGGYYWVLHERSKPFDTSTAYVIVDRLKFINDGKVYFLFEDGRVESKHKVLQGSQLAYVYD